MDMKVRFCYVGHGAMNYIQVYDRTGHVTAHLLVDAGSTDDKTDGSLRERNLDFVSEEISSYPAPVYVFITHFHEDHYNLLDQLHIPWNVTGGLYVGSIQRECEFDDPENKLRMFWNTHERMNRRILERITTHKKLLTLGNVQIYCLWNNYFTDITDPALHTRFPRANRGTLYRNRNGAAFAFLCGQDAVVFSGDMTGANFWALFEGSLSADVTSLLNGYTVWMTVPHHGSLHTLSEPVLSPLLSLNLGTLFYAAEKLIDVMQNVFQNPVRMYISAGYRDRHSHPNYVASIAYDLSGNSVGRNCSRFEVYKGITNIRESDHVQFEGENGREFLTWGVLEITESSTFSLLGLDGGYEELIF